MNPGESSQTTTSIAPPWQSGYQNYGLNQAYGLYQNGPQIAGFSPMQEQALSGIQNLAGNNPLTHAASGYATNELNGQYLNPQSNPYLNATFTQAANATQNQLASEFGTNGSNVLNSLPVQSNQLNNLATQIYGGNYQNERALQNQALQQAPNTQTMGYNDLNQLYGGGQQVQNLAQTYASAPANWLNQYMAQVGPSMGQQTTQPMYYNQGAGALGGALAGSQLGSQMGLSPWLGALAGGLLGG